MIDKIICIVKKIEPLEMRVNTVKKAILKHQLYKGSKRLSKDIITTEVYIDRGKTNQLMYRD